MGTGRAQQPHVWAQLGCSFWVELVPVQAAQVSVAVKELPVQCYSGKEPVLGQVRLPCLRVPVPSMWSCRQTHRHTSAVPIAADRKRDAPACALCVPAGWGTLTVGWWLPVTTLGAAPSGAQLALVRLWGSPACRGASAPSCSQG